MYLVKIEGEKHSAWNTKKEAINQIRVLKDCGYKSLSYDFDSTIDTENGHYYC